MYTPLPHTMSVIISNLVMLWTITTCFVSVSASTPSIGPVWELLAAANTGPSPRQGQASFYCPVFDEMIVWSGFSGDGELDFDADLWAWNFPLKQWSSLDYSTLSQKPLPRVWHSLVGVVDPNVTTSCRAILYGGSLRVTAGSSLSDLPDTWLLEVFGASGPVSWTPLVRNTNLPNPGPRSEHVSLWRRGSMILFGGSHLVDDNSALCYADIWQLDSNIQSGVANQNASWTLITPVSTSPVPKPRFSMSVALQTGDTPDLDRLHVFAGRSFTGSDQDWVMLSDYWVFTFGTLTWKQIPGLALARSYHTAVVVGNDMYVFGGYTRVVTSTTSSIYVFNDVLVTSMTGLIGADATNAGDPGCMSVNGETGLWCIVSVTGVEPNVRYDHTMALRRDEFTVFAGRFEAMLGDLWSFNTTRSVTKWALATQDQLGSSDLQSTMYFMIAILTMMVICFFVFVVSLRRQRTHPIFVQAMQRLRPMGARPHVIAALPLRTFHKADKKNDETNTDVEGGNNQPKPVIDTTQEVPNDDLHDMCAICLTDYDDGTQVRVLPCTHFFHPACIDQWLQRNNACPMCKHGVDENPYAPEPPGVAAAQAAQAAAAAATAAATTTTTPPPASATTTTTTATPPVNAGEEITIVVSGSPQITQRSMPEGTTEGGGGETGVVT